MSRTGDKIGGGKAVSYGAVLFIIICVLIQYEVSLRSMGLMMMAEGIRLGPAVWFADVGLVAPIFLCIIMNRFDLIIGRRLVVAITLCFAYGGIIFLARGNAWESIGTDVRAYVAILSGIAMVLLLRRRVKDIVLMLNLICLILIILSIWSILSLPDFNLSTVYERRTDPIAFLLLGSASILLCPALIGAYIYGNRALVFIGWTNIFIVLVDSIVLVQTRSLFITTLCSAVLGLISSLGMSRSAWAGKGKNRIAFGYATVVISLVMAVAAIVWRSESYDSFAMRMLNAMESSEDVGLRPRLDEIDIVKDSMGSLDLVVGMGLNPPNILIDWVGNEYDVMHIAILNIWWRFGGIIFCVVILNLLRLVAEWMRYVLWSRSKRVRTGKIVASAVCVPGAIVWIVMSLTSGGWGKESMIGLGMLMGLYWEIADPKAAYCEKRFIAGGLQAQN
jgi:hypothetical protein